MSEKPDSKRRDFLQLSTLSIGAVGTAAFIWPFLKSMSPAEDTLALGTTEVDVSSIEEGQSVTVKWRGKPVFIRKRTKDEIDEAKTVNIADLKESRFISFNSDISDEYTVSNWTGTSYIVTTKPITSINPKNVEIKGFDEIKIPLALGNRKDQLSSLEKALNLFFKSVSKAFCCVEIVVLDDETAEALVVSVFFSVCCFIKFVNVFTP